jgi:hypothetical protein
MALGGGVQPLRRAALHRVGCLAEHGRRSHRALNRAFGAFYKVRLHAKRVRKTRKKLYYAIKFSLIALVLLAILWP